MIQQTLCDIVYNDIISCIAQLHLTLLAVKAIWIRMIVVSNSVDLLESNQLHKVLFSVYVMCQPKAIK